MNSRDAASGTDDLREALLNARVVVWELDYDTSTVSYREAPGVLLGLGFNPEFLPPSLEAWLALVHPDDRSHVQRRLASAFAEGGVFEAEYRVRLPNAEAATHWIESRGRVHRSPARKGPWLLGVSLDTTGRKRAEAELANRQQTLNAIFAASPDVINLVDLDGKVRYASQAVKKILGYDPGVAPSDTILDNVHPDDRAVVAESMRAALEGRTDRARLRVRYRRSSGDWIVLEVDGERILDSSAIPTGLVLVSRDVTEHARLEAALREAKANLEEKVRERTAELEAAQVEVIERLALAAEYRDDATGQHIRRVGDNAATLAAAIGLATAEADLLRRAAPLHDVGKIGIPDGIFLKPGRFTSEEFEVVKTHTSIGAQILAGGCFPLVQMAEQVALHHHERWDGKGYPNGLSEEAIPLIARIVSVVDVFDALTHERPYKKAWTAESAVAEIRAQSSQQFDPVLVSAFADIANDMVI